MLEDFRGIADVSQSYAAAAPDLLRLIDNSAAVSRNVVDQKDELATFLRSTTAFNSSTQDFLQINERSLIDLAAQSRPNLQLYAEFSPEYACMLHTLPKQEIVGEKTFGGIDPWLHITLEVAQDQGSYLPGDEPKFREDRGPTCYGLTGKPIVPMPAYYEPKDGYCDAEEAASPGVTTGNCHGASVPPGVRARAIVDPTTVLGTPEQVAAVGAAVGPVMQLPPDEVPDIATLLFGPVARGATVGYSRA
jgi:hypothetical protein